MKIEKKNMPGQSKNRIPTALRYLLLAVSMGALSACVDNEGKETTLQDSIVESVESDDIPLFTANFKLSSVECANVIPYPNNVLFANSDDGTLNIEIEDCDTEGQATLKTVLNTLDGFSTTAPINTTFNIPIDPSTVIAGSTVRVFEVTLSPPPQNAVVAVNEELGQTDFVATVSGDTTLVVLPIKPLKPKTTYMVVVTNGVKSTNGIAAKPDLMYETLSGEDDILASNGSININAFKGIPETALRLAGLQQLTRVAEAAAIAYTVDDDLSETIADVTASDIVISWNFTTQSTEDVFQTIKAMVNDDAFEVVSSISPAVISSTLAASGNENDSRGNVYVGTLEVPYYLTAFSANNPTAPLTEYWRAENGGHLTWLNSTPGVTSTQTIPLLVTVPKNGVAPWPVVIFQHGIRRNRTDLLAVANALADEGFAAVAIDLPLHGLSGDEEVVGAFKAATEAVDPNVVERHFEMDLVDNTTFAPGPDGVLDAFELNFINLRSPLTSRDNVRQAVADLMVLRKSIATMDYDGVDNGPDFDTNRVYLLGQSLGSIVGATYLAVNDAEDPSESVKTAVLSSPGGGIAKMLDGSPEFGPTIHAGLAAEGLIRGTADYESFMGVMQTALDSSDPINYTAGMGANRGVLLFEIVGGENDSLPDQVIPNSVTGAPLSGTTPLAAYMGLRHVSVNQFTTGEPHKLWLKFNVGHHGSLLTSSDDAGNENDDAKAVFDEMQKMAPGFLKNGGANLNVSNTSILVQP